MTKSSKLTDHGIAEVPSPLLLDWTIRHGVKLRFTRPMLAGIINVTPDSFSDGGLYHDPENAFAHACELFKDGAEILDLGGESTRPGAVLIGAEAEKARLLPLLAHLTNWRKAIAADSTKKELVPSPPKPLISVDTWRAETAQAVLESGADIINDVYGAVEDPQMAEVLAQYAPGYILGHSIGTPEVMQKQARYTNIMDELLAYFESRLNFLLHHGVQQKTIMLDPGIGFAKNLEHNLTVLRNIPALKALGFPLCIGLSRKRMFGDLFQLPAGPERDLPTAVTVSLLATKGVELHRVHAVKESRMALTMATALA